MSPAQYGDWKIVTTGAKNSKPVVGYYNPQVKFLDKNWTLRRVKTGIVWMSVVPMELESLATHNYFARGSVCVLGLGLGVLLYNLLLNRKVTDITVVELDQDVIDMTSDQARANKWPWFESVNIIQADALQYRSPEHKYDVVLADIWPRVGQEELRPDMQTIVENITADSYAAWTMELDFVTWLHENKVSKNTVSQKHYVQYAKDIGIPLIGQNVSWMAKLALQAATVQVMALGNKINHDRWILNG